MINDKTTILDKLKEYEKTGQYDGAVGDIYALIHQIADLEEEIDDLEVEAREKEAWEGRYNALLEECEASRPHSNRPGMSRFAKTARKRENMTTPQEGDSIG